MRLVPGTASAEVHETARSKSINAFIDLVLLVAVNAVADENAHDIRFALQDVIERYALGLDSVSCGK